VTAGIELTEETIFTWGAPPLKFGAGAVDEIGFEMAQFGARRVLILTDPQISALGIPARIAESLTRHGITSEIFDGVHVEPTDDSMDKAAGYAREQGPWDGFIAVGGGSSIDTAKAVNLMTTDGGSNPVSDLWCEKALTLLAQSFRTAFRHGDDLEARGNTMLAATFAGMGFGNSGVHIPHANAYPIAGMVKDYRPPNYPQDEPMVPHGMSVSLTAPEAFRFSFPSAPERHLAAAALLAPDADKPNDPGEQLPAAVIRLMRDIEIPNGIGAVGYTEADIPDLVPGTMKQQRLLATCPRPVDEEDIAGIFARSMENW